MAQDHKSRRAPRIGLSDPPGLVPHHLVCDMESVKWPYGRLSAGVDANVAKVKECDMRHRASTSAEGSFQSRPTFDSSSDEYFTAEEGEQSSDSEGTYLPLDQFQHYTESASYHSAAAVFVAYSLCLCSPPSQVLCCC